MNDIAAIVLPVFGLIGIGYAVAWTRFLPHETGNALSEFVFVIAIPMLIFRIVATADFAGLSAWRLWLPFFSSFAVSWAIGTVLMQRLFGRDARGGLVGGLAAGYGNTTLIGIPLALAAYGTAGSVPMALIVAVQMPIMMAMVALLMVRAERRDGVATAAANPAAIARSVAMNLVENPIVVGMAAGALWRFAGIPFDGFPAALVNRLADVASTLALFAMGMSLRRYGIRGNVPAGLVLTGLKLLLMPALVLVIARLVGLPEIPAKVAVIAAACPTGVTPFLVAGRFRTGEGLASNAITLSTLLAVVSVTVWLTLVDLI
ncbi:MAG TPA: AEC family transporter [Bauldia sp.]|nr:AEC family transporter [Bauldia sp.]